MKRLVYFFALISFSVNGFAQQSEPVQKKTTGDVAGYTSRDATVLSMMGWGVALAVGIATLCALIEKNDSSSSHSH